MAEKRIYGLVAMAQEALITAHCFGDCGQISIGGALIDDQIGPLWLCDVQACPHLKKQMDEPFGTSDLTDGEPIYLRSIQ
jgi:hypothetical protein